MKNVLLTIVALSLLYGTAYAEKPAMAFGATTTAPYNRIAINIGGTVSLSQHVRGFALIGATPTAKKVDDLHREITATASIFVTVKPWQCSRISLLTGVVYDHLIAYERGSDPDNPQRWILGEIGASLAFARNWEVSISYRRGVTQTDTGTFAYTPDRLSIRLFCWVI